MTAFTTLGGSLDLVAGDFTGDRFPDVLVLGKQVAILLANDGKGIFTDVTAVVSMERELRRSERMAAVGGMAQA